MERDGAAAEPLPELLSTELVCRTDHFDIVRATLRERGGEPFRRLVVEHPGAVALVALDGDGRWLLVEQYRHPAGQRLLEIPAGTREPGEAPAVTAQRELREETGFAAGTLRHLGGAWMAPGYTAEYIDFYLATDLVVDPLPADADEGISAPLPLTEAEVWAAIAAGTIADAKTLVALSLLRAAPQPPAAGPGGTAGT